ncbi:MAG TPA: GDSL-type esterase/lipase family protein [Xanthobacteraceae bacterium]|nr:GDSL-type esterase/lipase family protein [Xanthobacteraceae bacterium]
MRTLHLALLVAAGLLTAVLTTAGFAKAPKPAWVTAWATSQQGLGATKITNATVRMIARVTLPGDAVRIRLDNTFGTVPVTFAKASIGLRVRGPAVAAPLVKPLTFAGKDSVTIAPGASAESDSVPLHVEALQDVAVSLFVPDADVQPSQHNNAQVTSYLTDNGGGDQTASTDGKPFTAKTTSMFWLKSIDVQAAARAGAIVAFGDSITDGTCTTLDAHERWEDAVAERLALGKKDTHAVINEGIGGNTVTSSPDMKPPLNSPAGVERLDRDVLSHAGVSHVIVFLGTNDIRRGAPAQQVIAGLKDIIARVKQKGIKIIGVTIIPRDSVVPGIADTGWSDDKTKVKNEVNDWIRKDAGFDAVLDFDKLMRDPGNPDIINAAYDCSDGVHPSPYGYFLLGKSVDLGLFKGK